MLQSLVIEGNQFLTLPDLGGGGRRATPKGFLVKDIHFLTLSLVGVFEF